MELYTTYLWVYDMIQPWTESKKGDAWVLHGHWVDGAEIHGLQYQDYTIKCRIINYTYVGNSLSPKRHCTYLDGAMYTSIYPAVPAWRSWEPERQELGGTTVPWHSCTCPAFFFFAFLPDSDFRIALDWTIRHTPHAPLHMSARATSTKLGL